MISVHRQTRTGADPSASRAAPSSDSPEAAPSAATEEPLASLLDPLKADLADLSLSAAHYVSATRDLIVSKVRSTFLELAALLAGACILLSAVVTAVVFILQGISLLLTDAFGGRLWAGQLLTGTLVLMACGLVAIVLTQGWNRNWHQRVMAKYGYYKQRERAATARNERRAAQSNQQ